MTKAAMKISIITVCYNSAEFIQDALRSVDCQTWRNIEHIVVDGGSNDGTQGIVASHSRPWRRLISERDAGIYDAMNKGIALASGDVVGFINSDDFLANASVLAHVGGAFQDSTIEVCYGDLWYVGREDPNRVVRRWKSSVFSPGCFRWGWCPPHPTFYVRKRSLERLGSFDLGFKIASDVDFMIRYLEVNRSSFKYIPEVLVKMRMGGVTNRSWKNIYLQNVEIMSSLRMHGLQPSLARFALGKVWLRGRQFLPRLSQQ